MKFLLTMNMPSRNNPIHQIICEYPATGIADFCKALESKDFLVVEEFYKNNEIAVSNEAYYSVGMTGLNHRYIGKIKELSNSTTANKPRRQDY
jgi:hypothetical protein